MKILYALTLILSLLIKRPGFTDQNLSLGQTTQVQEDRGLVDLVLDLLEIFTGPKSKTQVPKDFDGTYKVIKVVDGDTLVIDMDGKEERLRLLGVDTPESVHPDKDKNIEFGTLASEFTKLHLEGKTIGIEYDKEKRDRYDRLLAYVYVDGEMFNKTLLENGMAKVTIYQPNDKYEEEFLALEQEAKAANMGLWAYENLDKNSLEYKLIELFRLVRELFGFVKDLAS